MFEVPCIGEHVDEVRNQPIRLAGSKTIQKRPRDPGDDQPSQVQ